MVSYTQHRNSQRLSKRVKGKLPNHTPNALKEADAEVDFADADDGVDTCAHGVDNQVPLMLPWVAEVVNSHARSTRSTVCE